MSVPRLVAIAGCVAVGSLAVAGCGGGSSSTTVAGGASGASGASGVAGAQVSASDFVAAVCPAVVGLKSTVAKQEASFQQAISGETDPAAGKSELSKLSSTLSNTMQQFATTVKAAGTPDVPNGDQIKSQLDAYLDAYVAVTQQLQSKVRALPTSPPQAFNSAVQSLKATLDQKSAQLSQSAPLGDSPEIKQAAEQTPACQPLVQGG